MAGAFRFRHFTIANDRAAMKVGTDGVLLGAWTELGDARNILDVGTGTGIIALMLAQRCSQRCSQCCSQCCSQRATIVSVPHATPVSDPAAAISPTMPVTTPQAAMVSDTMITAIDIDTSAIEEARDNFQTSPWNTCLRAECISLQDFVVKSKVFDLSRDSVVNSEAVGSVHDCLGKFDLIVSNPPFFNGKRSIKAPDERRSTARHTDTLGFRELAAGALSLLSPEGRLAVIYPVDEGMEFIAEAETLGLHLTKMCKVSTSPGKPPKRLLMEFSRSATAPFFDSLDLSSEKYTLLVKDFYL